MDGVAGEVFGLTAGPAVDLRGKSRINNLPGSPPQLDLPALSSLTPSLNPWLSLPVEEEIKREIGGGL